MIKNRNVDPGAEIEARKLAGVNKNSGNFTFDNFANRIQPAKITDYAEPTGAAGDENFFTTGNNTFEYHILGTQTILAPVQAAAGLDIGMDQTENDGVELTQGIAAAAKHAFTIGTDAAFYLRVLLNIANVSGCDDCAVGFRLAEAYQANVDDYNDMAALNVISGAINIETIIGGAGTTTTVTTHTVDDGVDVDLTVIVGADGKVIYEIDSATPKTVAAFTLTDGIVVLPFLFFLHAGAPVAGVVAVKEWECGYWTDKLPVI